MRGEALPVPTKNSIAVETCGFFDLPLLCSVAFAPIHSGDRLADRHKGTVLANSAQRTFAERVGENSDSVTPPVCRGGVSPPTLPPFRL